VGRTARLAQAQGNVVQFRLPGLQLPEQVALASRDPEAMNRDDARMLRGSQWPKRHPSVRFALALTFTMKAAWAVGAEGATDQAVPGAADASTTAPPAPAVAPAGIPVATSHEGKAPETELPRESAIENALGQAPSISASAFGGYGELTLNVPSNAPGVVDLRRFVLFFGHNFTDRIRFYSEFEVEHAVASSTDKGEAEVEQAYLDGLLSRRLNLRGGLILMPMGIVNVYHEPPSFNGVDRPDVDQFVIPSTWRSGDLWRDRRRTALPALFCEWLQCQRLHR
jgi:hypothetical protein